MTNNLFDTEEKVNKAIDSFNSLKSHPGWVLFKLVVEANIEVLEQRVLNGFEGETKEDIDRIRDKIHAYKEMIDTPENIIKNFSSSDDERFDEDPYETIEELRLREKAQRQTEQS